MDSILISIKKLLGIDESVADFDEQLVIFINSTFGDLNQLGVGPSDGYEITGASETWADYMGTAKIGNVKNFIYLKTRLVFDPPSNSFAVDSISHQISELEWRINVQAETQFLSPTGTETIDSVESPLVLTDKVLSIPSASDAQDGYMPKTEVQKTQDLEDTIIEQTYSTMGGAL